MDTTYSLSSLPNAFSQLDDKSSLVILGLALAANDLSLNSEAIEKFSPERDYYFFLKSLEICRETAKLLTTIEKSEISTRLSNHTTDLLRKINRQLGEYKDEASIVKGTLKPIRDASAHYYSDSTKNEIKEVKFSLEKLKQRTDICVHFQKKGTSANEQQYVFADHFRKEVTNQLLKNKLKVSEIALIAANTVQLVDSLLYDLIQPPVNQ